MSNNPRLGQLVPKIALLDWLALAYDLIVGRVSAGCRPCRHRFTPDLHQRFKAVACVGVLVPAVDSAVPWATVAVVGLTPTYGEGATMSATMTSTAAREVTRIFIAGAGPTAITALEDLCKVLQKCPPRGDTEIKVCDERGRFAAGDAFGTTWPSAVLNTDPNRMGPLDDPGQFARRRVQESPVEPGGAMARSSFGEDARAQVDRTIRQLAQLGVSVRLVAEEVTAIEVQQVSKGSGYVVQTNRSRHDVDFVIMATGRLSAPGRKELMGLASYVMNPWAPGALDAIPQCKRVIILGTSLTTVDIVGRLQANGHRGVITAVARSRGLPTVQNLGGAYVPSVFTHAGVEARSAYGSRRLTAEDVLMLLCAELRAAGVAETNDGVLDKIHQRIDLALRNPHAALLKDIAEAQAGRATVSAVIGALNDATRFTWPLVSDEDARQLLRYKSRYAMFANAMPLTNARMMERAMAEGLLRVHGGLRAVTYDAAAGCYTATTTDPDGRILHHEADTVVVATGNTRQLTEAGPLIRQMLADRAIREHPRGGVDITPAGRVIHADGTPATGLWWIGEATEGARLGTNCIRVMKHHSRATVEDLAGQMVAERGNR